VCTTVCGDGIKAGAEQCDDNNVVSGDGCDSTCHSETTQIITAGPGLAAAIVDNAYAGTLASMTCVNLVVPPFPLNNVASATIQINMSHTWIGDLTFKLVSALGTTVTLMSRPGFADVADDGTGASSESSNLVLGFPIMFQQGAATSSETMGSLGGTAWRVCQDDGICTFAPNNGSAPAGDLTSFNGQAANGTWKFCVGDGGAGDVGSIDKVVLTLGKQ
jgi:cysteine-rich repeat protein